MNLFINTVVYLEMYLPREGEEGRGKKKEKKQKTNKKINKNKSRNPERKK